MKIPRTTIASGIFVLVVALTAVAQAQAQGAKTRYPSMAPIEQYLMADRNAEIALARSAAPEAISRDAKILVLTKHGYETAVEGKNGWACVVDRSWTAPFDSPEFWNPSIRGPVCLNPPAVRSILPITFKKAEIVLAGQPNAPSIENIKAAFDKEALPALEPGAMSYMMSKSAYLTDDGGHNLSHLMFYTPPMDAAAWGADLPKSPVMLIQQFKGTRPSNIFIVSVGRWSDGTAAPVM